MLACGNAQSDHGKFRADLVKVMRDPEVKEKFASLSVDAMSGTPDNSAHTSNRDSQVRQA
jgi:hypothetical protein